MHPMTPPTPGFGFQGIQPPSIKLVPPVGNQLMTAD